MLACRDDVGQAPARPELDRCLNSATAIILCAEPIVHANDPNTGPSCGYCVDLRTGITQRCLKGRTLNARVHRALRMSTESD